MADSLLASLKAGNSKSERICFHDNASSMQIMMIALAPQATYDFFRNKNLGKIVFFGLMGEIKITWCDVLESPKNWPSCLLSRGNSLTLNKTYYRRTVNTLLRPSIFLECIDGPFDPLDKEYLS